jgi:hypothetical protein
MKEVHAVSDEIQAALDVRDYYLMRLRRFEAPITPETPYVPNQLCRANHRSGKREKTEAKPKPEEESHAAKEAPPGATVVTHGRDKPCLDKKNNRRHSGPIPEWF